MRRRSSSSIILTQQQNIGRNDNDNIYEFDEIISDAFSHWISLNKLHIAFYLLSKYNNDVFGDKISWIKNIFDSFRNDDSQINHVMYLEERLYILEKINRLNGVQNRSWVLNNCSLPATCWTY